MPVAKLTKRFVDTVTADARRILYYDSELTGFCLKVMPSGQMRWCVAYRPGGGGRGVAKKRLVLGSTSALAPERSFPDHVWQRSQKPRLAARMCRGTTRR